MDGNVGRVERAMLKQYLNELLATEHGLDGAMFCTSDGFDLASTLPGGVSPETFAAMVSSQFALGDALCREVGHKLCRDLVVDAATGKVLILEIPQTGRGLVLAGVASTRATLGQVLYACRRVAAMVGSRVGGM
ncbi:MAG TPA: roadblock/LC7 domain-containing protein [Oleiagrimonas sp.]|nr:roadblock/LC7 domain-containing protein [Oleiagrimonas sp.]